MGMCINCIIVDTFYLMACFVCCLYLYKEIFVMLGPIEYVPSAYD